MRGENITHPVLLYHVANTEDRQSIMQHGLLRSKSWAHMAAMERGDGITTDENPLGGIFFASKPSYQRAFDLWEVDVRGLYIEPDATTDPEYPEDTWWVTYEEITPQRLTLLHAGTNDR